MQSYHIKTAPSKPDPCLECNGKINVFLGNNSHDNVFDIVYGKDMWVFPWTRCISMHVTVTLPDNTIGLIVNPISTKLIVETNIITDTQDITVNVRKRGFLPKKIKAGTKIARLAIIESKECHLLI